MGYTHYWSFKNIPKGKTEQVEKLYQQAIKDIQKIAKVYNSYFESGDDRRLSGYTAYSNKYGGVKINGSGDNAHEDFYLSQYYKQNRLNNSGGFCKTAYKPYDLVVTAALSVLKYRLGDLIVVGSDGQAEDWKLGVEFASKVLRRKIRCPLVEYTKPTKLQFSEALNEKLS